MSVITRTFAVLDQIIFVASIAIGAFVGIYFAYLAPKESHQEADYLFGGRKMKTVPIALSLVASCISRVAMIGFPSEVYVYGMQCVYSKLLYWIVIYFYNTQILPVFHAFQGLSLNEYFEKRYDKRLRLHVSTLYFFSSVSYLPMLMYVPALVYEQGHCEDVVRMHTAASQPFGTIDVTVFLLSIAISAFVGIYFAYLVPKGSNEEAYYLVGNRNMGIFPIAMSLVASHISGITLLGVPSEVNAYGCQVFYYIFVYWITSYVYIQQILQVFHNLQGLSLNEYFEKRFDRRVRILGSILYVMNAMAWLPIVIFVPALAYEQVTGYSVHFVTPFVCLVCILYTSLGGIKAVVWTDVVQMLAMIACIILVAVKGTINVGGFAAVWEKNVATGRIEPPLFDLDPTVRHTIFGIAIGGFVNIMSSGCLNQGMVQRHQSLKTLSRARKAVWGYTVLVGLTFFLSGYCGLLIAAHYYHCDPITIQLTRTKDQVVPLFVIESLGSIPGLTGLFIAGIFSAALSSMSTALNTMSAVFLEDWIRGMNIWDPTHHQAFVTMKIFVVVMGVITFTLVFVVEKLGMVLQMFSSITALANGAMFTLFTLGLFFPSVTATGALVGAATAVISVAPILFSTQVYLSQGLLHFPAKPVSLEGCTQIYNVSQEFINTVKVPEETLWPMGPTRGDVWYPSRISYLWYAPISVTCGLAAALLFTLFISRTNLKDVDRRFIAPVARRWLPKSTDDLSSRGTHIVSDLEEMTEPTAYSANSAFNKH